MAAKSHYCLWPVVDLEGPVTISISNQSICYFCEDLWSGDES